MGRAVRDVESQVRVAFKEVQKQQINACRRGLTRVDGHLEKGLDNTFIVNQEVDIFLVDEVIMRS